MSLTPDQKAARQLWAQLETRITTQPLHYRSGQEVTAAVSISSLFPKVREILEQEPEADKFRELSVSLLNDTLRPYTSRWHSWMIEDPDKLGDDGKPLKRFRDEQVRRQFRKELKALQPRLCEIRTELEKIAGITPVKTAVARRTATLGDSLSAGIKDQVDIPIGENLVAPDGINKVELATVYLRRKALRTLRPGDQLEPSNYGEGEGEKQTGEVKPAPPADAVEITDAIGLALSGGGIRSATFCLGITQVLASRNLLTQFDYLSTVSGGGYFGSFLSCALGTRRRDPTAAATPPKTTPESAAAKINDVFQRAKGIESGLVRHLRNNSKYLLNGGFLGKTLMAALMLGGMGWNIMIMLPIPLVMALLAGRFGPWFWNPATSVGGPVLPSLTMSPAGMLLWFAAFGTLVSWIALPGFQLLAHGVRPKSWRSVLRNLCERLSHYLALLTVAAALLYLLPALFHGHEWLRCRWHDLWAGRLELPAIAELVPTAGAAVFGAIFAALAAWLAPRSARLTALAVRLFILSGPVLLLFTFLLVGNRLGVARAGGPVWSEFWVLVVTGALVAWDWLFVNINTLAPHRFYRNRLCECYLARRHQEKTDFAHTIIQQLAREPVQGKTEVRNQVRLSSLGADQTAPYHLINMTINAPTSENKNLRGRNGDFFMASRHFLGSPLTGYARTEAMERADAHFDLGTAMAVSGAAASTNMGWQTIPHFRFLMTLFNVRLGYWLPNPRRTVLAPPLSERRWRFWQWNWLRRWLLDGAGPWYFFREMVGQMDEKCRYVNLSDGGHIENLAAYELLRRRCKFIVCVDGGCEPGMECADLVRLQRYAEIDLGIRMHYDLGDLAPGPDGLSRAHAILVKIDYDPVGSPGTKLGWMLYLKLAVTGVEPAYVKDYRRMSPVFPHETTGDQFFEEDQFEAYRALGETAMSGMFREELVGAKSPENVRDWFQTLANNLLPDNDPVIKAGAADLPVPAPKGAS